MIELRLLGGFEVGGPLREQTRSILTQPRRAALLAFLAVSEPNGLQRRDRIVQMFWPESDPSAGRQSLRQALAFLRRAVGDDAFLTNDQVRGEEEVGVDRAVVRCDVDIVRRLLFEGELTRAAELYRGDFLDGLPDTGLHTFETWREEVADELRTDMRAALRRLSSEASAAGHADLAAHWARRELVLNPVDEPTMLHAMRALVAAGSVQEALETYDSFARVVTQEFDEPPSAEISAFADELRNGNPAPAAAPALAPAPATPAPAPENPAPATRPAPATSRLWPMFAVAAIALIAIVILLTRNPDVDSPTASNDNERPALLVLPFRVSGADSSLAYMRDGLPDLLGARVEGDVGWRLMRSSDAHDDAADALRMARSMGAAHVLSGTVMGTTGRVAVEVTLRGVPSGDVVLTTSVNGPADSVPLLADRIAALLLYEHSGYRSADPETLLRRPLPVLRQFLEGQMELRQGRYGEALRSFEAVLAIDRTFPQAAMGLGAAGRQTGEWGPWQSGLSAAWAQRDRLGKADSLYLVALAGPRFPRASTHKEVLDAWESVAVNLPEFGTGWFELGAHLLAWGPVMGIPRSQMRARYALTRAMELDSGLAEPAFPLIEIAIDEGDTAAVRALYDRYVKTGRIGESKDYVDWRVAHFFGEPAALARARSALDTIPYRSLLRIIGMAQVHGVGMADAAHAVELLRTRRGRSRDDNSVLTVLAHWALNHGALAEAVRERQASDAGTSTPLRYVVLDGLYAGGDTVAAARAIDELIARSRAAHPQQTGEPFRPVVASGHDLCVITQWHLWHDEPVDAQAAITSLRALGRTEFNNCATTIAAIDGVRNKRPNARALLEALDAAQRSGERPANDEYYGNIVAARLWEQHGDIARALAAARRRPHNHWEGPWYLRGFLTLEQRLAERAGDRQGAAAAARHLRMLMDV